MAYLPEKPPEKYDPHFLERELRKIADEVNRPLIFPTYYAAPDKPVEGQAILAKYDPGSGTGTYVFHTSAWTRTDD